MARHSGAQHASVRVAILDGSVRLEVEDDGGGLASGALPAGGHHGLANMRARAQALGGSFEIDSAPSTGTRIIVAAPRSGRQRRDSQ